MQNQDDIKMVHIIFILKNVLSHRECEQNTLTIKLNCKYLIFFQKPKLS